MQYVVNAENPYLLPYDDVQHIRSGISGAAICKARDQLPSYDWLSACNAWRQLDENWLTFARELVFPRQALSSAAEHVLSPAWPSNAWSVRIGYIPPIPHYLLTLTGALLSSRKWYGL